MIGQIGRVPLFGAGPRRYIRSRLFRLAVIVFWRALTASWRQKGKRKQVFPRAIRTTELPSNPSPWVCLNFIWPSWNGWNGTRLFVVVPSILTCFQVFVSIPTTKRKSWNSCELSAIGNILDCQYKTLGTINCDAQAAGRMSRAHA